MKRWLDDAIRVETTAVIPADKWTHVGVTYDGSRVAAGVKIYVDGKLEPIKVLLDELNQTFQSKEPLRIGAGGGTGRRFVGSIDEPSVYDAALTAEEIQVLATSESITDILRLPAARRTEGQARKLRDCFLATDAAVWARELNAQVRSARTAVDELAESIPTTMVMEELRVPRATHVLIRGQYDQLGARVEPGVPASLSAGEAHARPGRLELARWLVEPANPMTARVVVNRDWQMLFGTGLVKTVDDFGAQGEPPSHPELLDWLAIEFVRSGWDVKNMLRLIVTSATYRQSSRVDAQGLERDPENRLLAHAPRLRLPAEMIRDQALRLAGLLVERIGGPSVKPYQPPGLWNELADAEYIQDHGANLYRRSIYTFWKRTVPPPAMVAFDAPGRETCIVRESRTNTPLQALDVLNDVTYVEAARALAEQMMKDFRTTTEARLTAAFQAATARRPRPDEAAILRAASTTSLAGSGAIPQRRRHWSMQGNRAATGLSIRASWRPTRRWPSSSLTSTKPSPRSNAPCAPMSQSDRYLTRRHFFGRASFGLGSIALASLLDRDLFAADRGGHRSATGAGIEGFPNVAPRARRVIYLFQSGAPSQLDLFDPKPGLDRLDGTDLPDSIRMGQRLTGMTSRQDRFPVAASRFSFARHGQSGARLSELLPFTAKVADELCFIKTMHTEAINHDPAVTFFQTGAQLAGRPSIGAWVSYGLGSENQDLPAFVVMISRGSGNPTISRSTTGSGGAVFCRPLPGRQVPLCRRPGALPLRPAGLRRGPPAHARRPVAARRAQSSRVRRPGDPHPHRAVRDGVSDADVGARADRRRG